MKENIRFKLRTPKIILTIILAFFTIGAFYNVISRVNGDIMNDEEEIFDIIIVSLFGLFFFYKFIKNIIIVFDINKHKTVKKYGTIENLEEIVKEINATSLYDDKKIVISNNYISGKNNYNNIFHLDNVINVYQYVRRTNGLVTGLALVVVDKAGKENYIDYFGYEKDLLVALDVIRKVRKDIKIGYIR